MIMIMQFSSTCDSQTSIIIHIITHTVGILSEHLNITTFVLTLLKPKALSTGKLI